MRGRVITQAQVSCLAVSFNRCLSSTCSRYQGLCGRSQIHVLCSISIPVQGLSALPPQYLRPLIVLKNTLAW